MSMGGQIRKAMHGARAEKAKADAAQALVSNLKGMTARRATYYVAAVHLSALTWLLALTYMVVHLWNAQGGSL